MSPRRGFRRFDWRRLLLAAVVLVAAWYARDQGWWPEGGPASPVTALPPADEALLGPCSVRHVIDGDTVDLVCGGERHRIRMLRIDTPEREEPGYAEAREALRRELHDAQVRVVHERPGRPERDDYGRLLGYVLREQRNVNVEMVRQGWSRFFTRYGNGRFARAFGAAEEEARDAERGLWAQ